MMARDCAKEAITDLVPYEPCYTNPKLTSALRDLKRDKKFHPPADVFELQGEWFVRDATHHVLAALKLGYSEVPVVEVDPPRDAPSVLENWNAHIAMKGFTNLPACSGLADRGTRSSDASGFKTDKDKLLESLGKAKKSAEAQPSEPAIPPTSALAGHLLTLHRGRPHVYFNAADEMRGRADAGELQAAYGELKKRGFVDARVGTPFPLYCITKTGLTAVGVR